MTQYKKKFTGHNVNLYCAIWNYKMQYYFIGRNIRSYCTKQIIRCNTMKPLYSRQLTATSKSFQKKSRWQITKAEWWQKVVIEKERNFLNYTVHIQVFKLIINHTKTICKKIIFQIFFTSILMQCCLNPQIIHLEFDYI